jgi:hypothetical protein
MENPPKRPKKQQKCWILLAKNGLAESEKQQITHIINRLFFGEANPGPWHKSCFMSRHTGNQATTDGISAPFLPRP